MEKERVELGYRIGEELCRLQEGHCDEVVYLTSISSTTIDMSRMQKLEEENEQCSFSLVACNDELCTFYSGLSSKVSYHVFTFLSPHVSQSNSLTLEDELLFVMLYLRLGLIWL